MYKFQSYNFLNSCNKNKLQSDNETKITKFALKIYKMIVQLLYRYRFVLQK